jgi:hypothetical protein
MNNNELYKKYPHIMDGSIEEVPRGQVVLCGKNTKIISHGKIAIIKCLDKESPGCLKTRIINIQDAEQSKYCVVCTRRRRNTRRRLRRACQSI